MSLFGALLGELDDDPFMGGHMRRMNSMMNSFFRDPFGDMMGRPMSSSLVPFEGLRDGRRGNEISRFGGFGMGFPMHGMPMGFPGMNIFQSVGNNPNCHSFSSSTVMTMTPGPDGRPQIYQASQSVKQGPGGIRETKKTVADSRTGVKKMAIGHHINERGHIIEREQNVYSGEREEREDFINLDEDEAESFNQEWENKARGMARNNIDYVQSSGRRSHREPQLALPPSTGSQHNRARHSARSSRPIYHSSSSKPSTATLVASDSEDEEEDEEKEEKLGVKRKLEAEEISSEEEDLVPVAKRKSLTAPSLPKTLPPKSSSSLPFPSSSASK